MNVKGAHSYSSPEILNSVTKSTHSSMPAILHHSLSNTALAACLQRQGFRIRVSETSTENSVIFPVSKVAFFYFDITPAALSQLDSLQYRSGLLDSISKFVEIHCNCYVLLDLPSGLCDKTFDLMRDIQTQNLSSRLQVVPSAGPSDAAAAMLDIAKLQCRPLSEKMHHRFCSLLNRQLLENTMPRLLAQLGLDTHQQQLVQDGIGSLSKLASATVEDFMDCALDSETATLVWHFFSQPVQN